MVRTKEIIEVIKKNVLGLSYGYVTEGMEPFGDGMYHNIIFIMDDGITDYNISFVFEMTQFTEFNFDKKLKFPDGIEYWVYWTNNPRIPQILIKYD